MKPTPRGKQDLAAWLSWQETAHPKTWDFGLERISEVWRAMGSPKIAEHVLTVAGTNGKGSCVAWGEAICLAHGVSVASFTSPHILDYRERIRFNDEMISAADLCAAFDAVDIARGDVSLTFFEWAALGAFYAMAQKSPEVALLEVGLGGRLDAVNIIDADAACFTEIGLDHTQWLGDTVEKIAGEKAGIMRDGQLVAFADANPPQTLRQRAAEHHTQHWQFGKEISAQVTDGKLALTLPEGRFRVPLPAKLPGKHQFGHFAAVATLLGNWFPLHEVALSEAALHAHNTARLMLKDGKPRYVIDVSHNPDSAKVLAEYLRKIRRDDEKMLIVCGMLKDKDQRSVFSILRGLGDAWYLGSLYGERGTPVDLLKKHALEAGIASDKLVSCAHIVEALQAAEAAARANDTIVVMGSFVTVTEVLQFWSSNE